MSALQRFFLHKPRIQGKKKKIAAKRTFVTEFLSIQSNQPVNKFSVPTIVVLCKTFVNGRHCGFFVQLLHVSAVHTRIREANWNRITKFAFHNFKRTKKKKQNLTLGVVFSSFWFFLSSPRQAVQRT